MSKLGSVVLDGGEFAPLTLVIGTHAYVVQADHQITADRAVAVQLADEILTRYGARQKRISELEDALGLALSWLIHNEPGDSRAVSDEFVAMAAVHADLANDDALRIIRDASQASLIPKEPTV